MLKGKPAGETEQVTMNAIRGILSDTDTPKKPAKVLPKLRSAPVVDDFEITTQPVKAVETKMTTARFTTVPTPDETATPTPQKTKVVNASAAKQDAGAPAIPAPGDVARKVFRLPRLPKIDVSKVPTPKMRKAPTKKSESAAEPVRFLEKRHIVALAAIVLVAFRPGLVAAAVFLWFFLVVGMFLIFGADRIWRAMSWAVKSYRARNSEGADKLLDWLDGVAVRWDAVLDRFPDGMVDSLYMPDFANLENHEEVYDDMLNDRLDRMHSQV